MNEHPSWWDALPCAIKIRDWAEVVAASRGYRTHGHQIVLTNGVFDILHPGHLLKLQAVRRSPSDFVIVSLDTDLQVRADKGRYPALLWRERAPLIAALAGVDAVTAHGQGAGALTALVALLAPLRWHRRHDAPASEVAGVGVEVVRSERNGPWASSALRGAKAWGDLTPR